MKNGVIGIIWNEKRSKVLAVHRRDVDIWVLPGGGIEENETPEKTVVREIEEETGLQVAIRRKVGEYTPINRLTRLTYLYECDIIGGQLALGDESQEIKFISIEKMPKNFFPLHYEWVLDAQRNEPNVILRPIDSITYGLLLKTIVKHPIKLLRYLLSRLGFPINT